MKTDKWGARHDWETEQIDQDELGKLHAEHTLLDHVCTDECPYYSPDRDGSAVE